MKLTNKRIMVKRHYFAPFATRRYLFSTQPCLTCKLCNTLSSKPVSPFLSKSNCYEKWLYSNYCTFGFCFELIIYLSAHVPQNQNCWFQHNRYYNSGYTKFLYSIVRGTLKVWHHVECLFNLTSRWKIFNSTKFFI